MKSKMILHATIFTMLLFLIACNSNQKQEVLTEPNYDIISDYCRLHDIRPDDPYTSVMNAACADSLINNYQANIDTIKERHPYIHNVDDLLIRGARVSVREMQKIIDEINSDSLSLNPYKDSIYIMLAVHNEGQAGMIFNIQKTDPPYLNRYYNFTRPCPNACPD